MTGEITKCPICGAPYDEPCRQVTHKLHDRARYYKKLAEESLQKELDNQQEYC